MLVLESDRLLKQLIVEWLHMAGYETLSASDATSAARVASAGCDLILADVLPPIKSAREAVDRLKQLVPGARMVAMSAGILASTAAASNAIARELGASVVLVKPFTQEALLEAIQQAFA